MGQPDYRIHELNKRLQQRNEVRKCVTDDQPPACVCTRVCSVCVPHCLCFLCIM